MLISKVVQSFIKGTVDEKVNTGLEIDTASQILQATTKIKYLISCKCKLFEHRLS